MKNHGNINLLIDFLLCLVLALMAGIGFLIKYVLLSGRERILKYEENIEYNFLGWDRHEWGDIHLLVGWILLALLVLHILFHWNVIVCLVRRVIPGLSLRRWLVAAFSLLVSFLFVFPALIKPQKSGNDGFLYRNSWRGEIHTVRQNIKSALETVRQPNTGVSKVEVTNRSVDSVRRVKLKEVHHLHDHHHGEETIQGRMAIVDIAQLYGINATEVKKRLGVPDGVANTETLDRLRRRFGFSMSEARNRLTPDQSVARNSSRPSHENLP